MMWLVYLILTVAGASMIFANFSLAPWVPTRGRDLQRVFSLIKTSPQDVFYDLGCGNGATVFYANKNFNMRAVGVELSLPLYLFCVLKKIILGAKNVKIIWGNLFKLDLSGATIVYLFGTKNTTNQKLTNKLLKELSPGSRVISYAFPLSGLKPARIDKPTPKDLSIYIYKI